MSHPDDLPWISLMKQFAPVEEHLRSHFPLLAEALERERFTLESNAELLYDFYRNRILPFIREVAAIVGLDEETVVHICMRAAHNGTKPWHEWLRDWRLLLIAQSQILQKGKEEENRNG